MKLVEFKPLLSTNALFKGEPGTGKTPAALSYPYPTLFFDVDYRAQSLLSFFRNDIERLRNIEVVQPTHFDEVITRLRNIYDSLTKPEFKTVILDTLTTFSDVSLRSSQKEKGGSGGRKIGTVLIPGLQDFGDEAGILNDCMTLMRLIYQSKGINTILIAHVITTEEKNVAAKEQDQKIVYSRSLLTAGKKIGAKLPSYFDEVYHFTVRPDFKNRPEFIALTRHTGFDFARTGLDCPDEINFTNYERDKSKYFYEYIKKYMDKTLEDYNAKLKEEDKIDRQVKVVVDNPFK